MFHGKILLEINKWLCEDTHVKHHIDAGMQERKYEKINIFVLATFMAWHEMHVNILIEYELS